jgi:hypothetical protein
MRKNDVKNVSHMWDMRNAHKILVRKPEDKKYIKELAVANRIILGQI